ncbi:MAG: helix-hairpin-helix domain-containing protein [Chitinophagaceae bacterium]|nr:helix-hairpin-helix domain-containing protein [Chitinophagaceae bacterium]
MKIIFTWFILFLVTADIAAQVTEPVTTNTEQQLENITENNEDIETEDDGYLQQMVQYIKNPIALNEADAAALSQLRMLTPLQVQNFIVYRNLVGKLIDLYELQAVPGWDIATIQKLSLYVNVSIRVPASVTLKQRFKNGEHSLLVRASQVLERSKGYLLDSSTATNFYPGSPQKYLLRYTYTFRDLFQYGIVAEKDAGEQFFKGKQKLGFDFYSAHIFVRKMGIIHSLAVGDFTVNLGQGLIQWQSLAFKKSADVINVKREAAVLRPYHSAGEINFHRGLGITLAKKNWQLTVFGSYRNLDANLVSDTSQTPDDFISSLQTSGYHRTKSETADKAVQRQLAFGGNLSYRYRQLQVGINGIQYRFKLPLIKPADPYNVYALNGSSFGNYSIDYSYTFKNLHLFGEAAVSSGFDKAFINGLLISASSKIDVSLLYRNISRSFQSLYATAFTENTYPTNEKGLYAGISVRPHQAWRIDAYADLYKFPWLRYRVDAPAAGSDYLLQLTYKPNKQLEMYTRYHAESKSINVNPGQFTTSPVVQQPKKNWRTQVSYKLNKSITLRNRTEIIWFDKKGVAAEQGFLTYIDFIYKPMLKSLSGGIRLQYFETDGYNSRLYAYENDILYSFSIPVFYDKGLRYYINLNYDVNKKITLWIKWAQSLYTDKTLIGSGLDEINTNTKSEIKLQVQYKF